jgi:hypothetical protein
MMNSILKMTFLGLALFCGVDSHAAKSTEVVEHEEYVKTDAGNIDFRHLNHVKFPGVFHKIARLQLKDNYLELEDGSKWSLSRAETVKGWESNRVVLCQNMATLSTYRFALVNLDLKMAMPISLIREPLPTKDDVAFVKNIDRSSDIIVTSDGRRWIVHSSDGSNFSKFNEHDRLEIGANVSDSAEKCPYILIDTAHNSYVRAKLLD